MESGPLLRSNSGNSPRDVREEISGFVLAGGRSSRLGEDKSLLPWPGQDPSEGSSHTLLDHAIARLRLVCTTVSICADRNDLDRAEAVIPDALAGSGPLGGIVAALEQSATEWNIFLAVDLPFLPVDVLYELISRVNSAKRDDPAKVGATASGASSLEQIACILPQLDGLPQPLCGLYRRILAPGLREALEKGTFKIMAALRDAINTAAAPEGQQGRPALGIELWDASSFAASMNPSSDPSEWFLNVNTPEDWRRAQQRRLK